MNQNENAFTIIELIIAMFMSAIVLMAIGTFFISQRESYAIQQEQTEMQQNLRAAMFYLARDIQLAGTDPMKVINNQPAGAGIVLANDGEFVFTMDVTGGEADNWNNKVGGSENEIVPPLSHTGDWYDGQLNSFNPNSAWYEYVRFKLMDDNGVATGTADDGINDGTPGFANPFTLGRDLTGTNLLTPLAENIEVLRFIYFDEDYNQITTPVASSSLSDIQLTMVVLIARADSPDIDFVNNANYEVTLPDATNTKLVILPPQGDNFRREMYSMTINMHNM